MKIRVQKYFQYFGLILLMCFSFYFAEKTANKLKSLDKTMIAIKEYNAKNKIDPVDSLIVDDTIVPGLYGREVNEKESYKILKQIGIFSESYLKYNYQKPKKSISEIYNKYIIAGNPNKNSITLIFLVEYQDNIDKIVEIFDRNNVKTNFFVDGYWFENNNEYVIRLIDKKHIIGNLSYNRDYKDSGYVWMNTIIKKIGKQKNNYCYTEEKNDEILNICSLQRSYTIIPSVVLENNLSVEIKKYLNPGSIIAIKVNENTYKDLQYVIDFTNAKGIRIENLNDFINENIWQK